MGNKPVTIKDLARKLNMSVSTVSKALNNYTTVNSMTKERVLEMARALNFTPNQSAILFKQQKSFTIGVIVPTLSDQFYINAVSGIEESAMPHAYKVIICQSNEEEKRESDLTEMMMRYRIDGLIISVSKNSFNFEHLEKLEQQGIPVVYLARKPANKNCCSVTSNVYEGSKEAVSLLIQQGHKRVGHIKGPDSLITSKEREQGYADALKQNNIAYDAALSLTTDLTKKSTQQAMAQLLALKNPPTAVLVFKDYVALDAMQYLKQERKKKKDIPHIAFIGFGDQSFIEYLDTPPYASLEEQPHAIGSKAAELLIHRIQNPDSSLPENIQYSCKIKIHNEAS